MTQIHDLVSKGILNILDGDKDSVLKQLEITNKLGAADAANISLAHLYGISFMTVDQKLVNNIKSIESQLEKIHNIYYTSPRHRAYYT